MAMPGDTSAGLGIARPGPQPGSAAAGVGPGGVGVRQRPNGRPPGPSVVPPPNAPVAPPPGAAGGAGGGMGLAGTLQPSSPPSGASPAQPAATGQPGRMPTGPELGMMGPGMSMELPVGTYTVGPDGQPQVVLNEAGMAAYQNRVQRFTERYRAAMPPDMRGQDVPMPQVVVGQRVLIPWTGEWVTV